MNITDTVLEYFESRGGLPGATTEAKLACAYLDAKIVDSMGIIEMVSHFEEVFGIQFDADHLQSPEFQTVGGVVAIIDQLRNPGA